MRGGDDYREAFVEAGWTDTGDWVGGGVAVAGGVAAALLLNSHVYFNP